METRATLKSYFETGDKPTQAQFVALIDSVPNISDDSSQYAEIILRTDITVTALPQTIDILAADATSYFLITECWVLLLEVVGSSLDASKEIRVGVQEPYSLVNLPGVVNSDLSVGIAEDLSSALQINCDELPAGITTLRLRVLCRGYKVSKT